MLTTMVSGMQIDKIRFAMKVPTVLLRLIRRY